MKTTSRLRVLIAAAVLSISSASIAFAAADTLTPPDQIAVTGMATGIEQQAPNLVLATDATEAPMLVAAAGTNESYQIQLAAAPTGVSSAGSSASGPSLAQKVGWGLVGATAVNLATGNVVGMAWTWHAVLTGAGGYVGATTVADKMK
ncbi:MAG: hypothetical protein NUV60_03450 [Patescibacteria group bacterium]|nr:hypothetical protein [Patescibacteria group bacterium]